MKPYPKNKFSSCPNCGQTGTITVATLVWSTGNYSDDKRTYAGGGMVEGALCASCDSCNKTFWQQEDVFSFTDTTSSWKYGPCPECHNSLIDELNLDAIRREFDGSYLKDIERLATPHYECQNCGEVLKYTPLQDFSKMFPC